jgi:hypothetical protein
MKTLRYIAIRLAFALCVFLLSAWIYQQWFYHDDLEKEGWLRLKLDRLEVGRRNILYLGASPNSSSALDEPDHRKIMDLVTEHHPELPIVSYDTGALHVGIFLHVLEWLQPEQLPHTVICELHLRSFSADWLESNLENSLQRNLVYTNRSIPLWNRIRVSLKDYPWVPPAERNHRINNHFRFDKLPYNDERRTVFHWFRALEKQYKGPPGMAGEYVKKFAVWIDERNPRLKQYDDVVDFCRKKKIRLIFVLYGENVEEAGRLVGKDLLDLMYRNVGFLVKRYTNETSEVVNCFDKIPDSAWYERNFVTEHYRINGRQIVADAILKQLLWKSGKHK